VARDRPLTLVLAHVPLNVRELQLRQVIALDGRLERRLQGVQLVQCLRRLGLLRADRGVANCWNCRDEREANPG
jgi:hypothetical protein